MRVGPISVVTQSLIKATPRMQSISAEKSRMRGSISGSGASCEIGKDTPTLPGKTRSIHGAVDRNSATRHGLGSGIKRYVAL